jgi:hypothetical protein
LERGKDGGRGIRDSSGRRKTTAPDNLQKATGNNNSHDSFF